MPDGNTLRMQKIVIPCELTVVPGGATTQNKLTLTASGETVFDDFEQSLSREERAVAGQICGANARLLKKYGEKLESGR